MKNRVQGMKNRSSAYYRNQAKRYIGRRKRIVKDVYGIKDSERSGAWKNDHYFSKGKVHCSCPMCRYHRDEDKRAKEQEKIAKEEIDKFYSEKGD